MSKLCLLCLVFPYNQKQVNLHSVPLTTSLPPLTQDLDLEGHEGLNIEAKFDSTLVYMTNKELFYSNYS